MQVFTAKEAKIQFGYLLDSVQREPVLVTKNGRPVAVFLSMEDISAETIEQVIKSQEYQLWLENKVNGSIARFNTKGSNGRPMSEVHADVLDKVRAKMQGKE